MKIPDNLKYTKDHEWIKMENNEAWIGITDYAQHELGDIVFVEVETVGEQLDAGEVFGTIEAVKTVSDLFMPASGEVVEFNETLSDHPELVNKDPYGDGWIIKVNLTNPDEAGNLLSAAEYKDLIDSN